MLIALDFKLLLVPIIRGFRVTLDLDGNITLSGIVWATTSATSIFPNISLDVSGVRLD